MVGIRKCRQWALSAHSHHPRKRPLPEYPRNYMKYSRKPTFLVQRLSVRNGQNRPFLNVSASDFLGARCFAADSAEANAFIQAK